MKNGCLKQEQAVWLSKLVHSWVPIWK